METNMNRSMTDSESGARVRDEMESLKQGLSKLRSDVAELFSHAFGFGRGGVDAARGYSNDAIEHIKDRFEDMRLRSAVQVHRFEEKVSKYPVRSAMIAFGVGFFLARLMHHRDRE
jgi:ElaB/YqjD/DUF883 family membrane-anchored ribosome-binding protein